MLTGGSFGSACDIDAGRINVCILPPPGQMPHQSHFEEIARRIDAMIIQMQLVAQMRNTLTRFSQGDFT